MPCGRGRLRRRSSPRCRPLRRFSIDAGSLWTMSCTELGRGLVPEVNADREGEPYVYAVVQPGGIELPSNP